MKKSLFVIALGIGIGYILGARAGRERYDLIVERVTGVWEDPRVAKARAEAARYAREQAPVLRDQAQKVAKATATRAQDLAGRASAATSSAASAAAGKVSDATSRIGKVRDSLGQDSDQDN